MAGAAAGLPAPTEVTCWTWSGLVMLRWHAGAMRQATCRHSIRTHKVVKRHQQAFSATQQAMHA
jgi:hypothetical protein